MYVKDSDGLDVDYVPAKAPLLYRVDGDSYCMCWKAQSPMSTDRRHETNVSARWKMQFLSSGLPDITSVPMCDVDQTIFVYQHFHNKPYHFPQDPVPPGIRASSYVIDEVYERYAWALNFLDKEHWTDES